MHVNCPTGVAVPKASEPPGSTQVGDPLAACHGAGRCPPAARGDRAIGGVATGLMTLVPAARDQRLRNRSAAALAWILLKGKGTRRGTEGEPEPGSGRRERTGERRTKGNQGRRAKGENPAGKREAGGKPAEETGGREVRPQTTRARARGSGAARICDAAGSRRAARAGPCGLAVEPRMPGSPRASASILCGLLIAADSTVMPARVAAYMACGRRPYSKRARPSWMICALARREGDLVRACVEVVRAVRHRRP